MRSISLLDLRLMLARQPLMALLLGVIILLAGALLIQQPPVQPSLNDTIDPARVIAAQRNFQGVLIPAAELAKTQQAVLDSAASHHLVIGRVEYAMENEAGAAFGRSSMNFPVTGRYADIRIFIESALKNHPAMAIRHLSIQRETSEASTSVTATLNAQFLVGRR